MEALTRETLQALQGIDGCTLSNAIEQFGVRLRNEGFMNSSVHCIFPRLGARVGYAVTGRVHAASTPVHGACYYHRMDWWSYVLSVPEPRFVVLQDADHIAGLGALVGEIHASIFVALKCVAVVTNGAVRDVPGMETAGLQVFAGTIALSHCYAHIADFGEPVQVAGLRVKPGDLLHGDEHGIQNIPYEISDELPAVAAEIVEAENQLISLCKSHEFSLDKLNSQINRLSKQFRIPGCGKKE